MTTSTGLNRFSLNFSMASKAYISSCLFLLGIIAVPSFGSTDMLIWLRWGEAVYTQGLISGYAANANDYPPLFFIYLWLCFKVADISGITPFYTIKISLFLCTLISAFLIYRFSKKNIIVTSLFYVSTLYTCVSLSYVDVLFYVPLIFSFLFLLKKEYVIFSILYTVSFLIKYPPLIIAPFLAVYVLYKFIDKPGGVFKNILLLMTKTLLPALVVIALIYVPFNTSLLFTFHSAFQDPYLNGQALNFNWLVMRVIRFTILPAFGLHEWPFIWSQTIFYVLYFTVFVTFCRHKRSFEDLLCFSIVGHLCYFIFSPGVHENHLLLSCLLSIMLAAQNPKYIWMAAGINFISIINLFSFYGYHGGPPRWYPPMLFQYFHNLSPEGMAMPNATIFYKYIPQEAPFFLPRSLLSILNVIYMLWIFVSLIANDFQSKKNTSIGNAPS